MDMRAAEVARLHAAPVLDEDLDALRRVGAAGSAYRIQKLRLVEAAKRALRTVGQVTGTGAIAETVLGMQDAAIERLVKLAEQHGVPHAKVNAALRAYEKAQDVQSAVAVLYPFLPNPALLRALAGRDTKGR